MSCDPRRCRLHTTGFPESDLIHVELKGYVDETKLDTVFAKLLLLLLFVSFVLL